MPGSTEKHMPGSTGAVWALETSPGSWTSRPMEWPVRWVKYSPYPARSMTSRAARSMAAKPTPGAATCSAAALAASTAS